MTRSGEGDEVAAVRDEDEANIRWLLAAVLHHQPDDESPDGDG